MRHVAGLACLCLSVAACGSNVTVEPDAGSTTTASTTSTPTGTTTTTTTSSTTTTTSTTIGVDGGGGGAPPVCRNCSTYLSMGPSDVAACDGSLALWDAFHTCACVKICPYPCGDLCKATPGPMSPECTDCVKSSCADTFSACLADP